MLTNSSNKYCCTLCKYTTDRKYNYDRHTKLVHTDNIIDNVDNNENLHNVENIFPNVESNLSNVVLNQLDVADNSQIVETPVENDKFKCTDCYKTFCNKYTLQRHITKCNRRQHPNQCTACLKCFSSRSGLSHHKDFCKGQQLVLPKSQTNAVVPTSSTNVNAENVQSKSSIYVQSKIEQSIQQQQNAETINNTNNTVNINILPCPQSREEKFDFDCENITYEDLIGILQKSKDSFLRFNRFVSKVLENPKNRVVRKLSAKDCHSLVHIGDDKWELAHDNDTFPIITHHMTTAALGKTIELDKNEKNYFIRAFQEQIRIFNEMDYDSLDYNSIVQRIKYHVINITRAVLAEEKRIRKEAYTSK